jgi:hypothetical protein
LEKMIIRASKWGQPRGPRACVMGTGEAAQARLLYSRTFASKGVRITRERDRIEAQALGRQRSRVGKRHF